MHSNQGGYYAEAELETNFTRQDSIILNLQRACEACIEGAMHIVRRRKLGIPQQSRDAFTALEDNSLISSKISERMQAMVGFRNIAARNYQTLSLPIIREILDQHLSDFLDFSDFLVEIGTI